ncbi:MAG TPA: hypothetical protein VKU41_03000 [Polyangiaceae bacterium]|nr:hypothetical protein [Polyangiaceae bacterium]
MQDVPERGGTSGLRGWLSDVYFPALVSVQPDQLVRRLGDRATVDDPIFGRANGPALTRYLEEIAAWLSKRGAAFERVSFVTGSDRDVTEGTLALAFDGRAVQVPVAVVAERRPEREVEIRLYYSTEPIKGTRAVRSPLLPKDDEVAVPPPVSAHLDALARGDLGAIVASFEVGGTLRDSAGRTYVRDEGGQVLRAFYEKSVAAPGGGAGGVLVLKGARADDGRTCALEYTVVRARGRDIAPQAGLAVYERGESGLLRTLRIYEDVEA